MPSFFFKFNDEFTPNSFRRSLPFPACLDYLFENLNVSNPQVNQDVETFESGSN